MTSTIIALSLLVLLMITLELAHRASDKHTMELKAARADIEGLKAALVDRDKDVRHFADLARVRNEFLAASMDSLEVAAGRIANLCEQLEETRKSRRKYHDVAAQRSQEVRRLSCELAESRLASFANLSDMTRLSALQQENKLDALCEVIKTLMQRDQLCDAAVASFGGRLSRAVQVYRKDRLKALADEHMAEEPSTCLIPGLAHLMAGEGNKYALNA